MRILLIESDRAACQGHELALKAKGFNVYPTHEGEEGIELARLYEYDIIVLNTLLRDVSGFEVVRQLRTAKVATPVMFLSTVGVTIDDKVRAFEAGADDFMIVPAHTDELAARITAIVRRSRAHPASIISVGDLAVNVSAKTVSVAGKPVHLTGKEYQMIELLALRKGSTLTKEMFLNQLYGGMDEPEIKIIDVFVCKLRKKLTDAGIVASDYLQTVWGRGYVLAEPVAP
jgi:two-component system cell cycle response regulator CtrA